MNKTKIYKQMPKSQNNHLFFYHNRIYKKNITLASTFGIAGYVSGSDRKETQIRNTSGPLAETRIQIQPQTIRNFNSFSIFSGQPTMKMNWNLDQVIFLVDSVFILFY